MNILIIEDEALAAKRIRKMVEELDASIRIAGMTDSIESSVEWLESNPHPDLILMDIELGDGQSFEIFNRVEVKSTIIFTTAYDEYAIRAFKVNSIDYLLKPVQQEDLKRGLEKFRELRLEAPMAPQKLDIDTILSAIKGNNFKDRFLVKQGQRFIPVDIAEIAYFYTEDKISFIRTISDQRYIVDFSLDELEQLLDPSRFFRANRQVILSPKALDGIHNHFNGKLKLQLRPHLADEVFVSREKAGEFRVWLGE